MRGARKKKVSPAVANEGVEGQKSAQKRSWIDDVPSSNVHSKTSSSGSNKNNSPEEAKEKADGVAEKNNPESSANQSKHNPSERTKQSPRSKKRKKTGLFGQRRRRRNGRSRNAQGKLVGAAAVAHEQKKQREELAAATEKKAGEAGNQGNGTAKMGITNVAISLMPTAAAEAPVEIVSIVKSSILTISGGDGQSARDTMEIGQEEKINHVSGIAGQKRGRQTVGAENGGSGGGQLHGAAAEAKKGKLMGAAAMKHAARMEQEEQRETSPVVGNHYRRSTEPMREPMAMNLRSSDRPLRRARQMRSI